MVKQSVYDYLMYAHHNWGHELDYDGGCRVKQCIYQFWYWLMHKKFVKYNHGST